MPNTCINCLKSWRKQVHILFIHLSYFLKETNKDNILAIQECIHSVSSVYVNESNEKNVTLLESILLTHINGVRNSIIIV